VPFSGQLAVGDEWEIMPHAGGWACGARRFSASDQPPPRSWRRLS
jgi:hypothetical protein